VQIHHSQRITPEMAAGGPASFVSLWAIEPGEGDWAEDDSKVIVQ
jgi:hypothetical protein